MTRPRAWSALVSFFSHRRPAAAKYIMEVAGPYFDRVANRMAPATVSDLRLDLHTR